MLLKSLLKPQSVAVIGASRNPQKIGHIILKNLLKTFKGKIYAVNPSLESVLGLRTYASADEINKQIDIGIIVVPAKIVPQAICQAKKVRNFVIISSGFSEIGNHELSQCLLKIIKKRKQRILGPNCFGVQSPHIGLNATFSNKLASKGSVAFMSQSGGFCSAMLDWAKQEKIGFSSFISVGNMLDVNFSDLINTLNKDKQTTLIAVYMEGLKDGRGFLDAALKSKKPIVILKVGKHAAGKKAAATHTGSMAGDYAIYQGAFRQAKIIEAQDTQELFDIIKVYSFVRKPKHKKLIIVTNSGGSGAAAADAAEAVKIELGRLSKNRIHKLNKILPIVWSKTNPVDLTGSVSEDTFKQALDITSKEKGILLITFVPIAMLLPLEIAAKIASIAIKKPCVACFIGGEDICWAKRFFAQAGVACYDSPERAVRAIKHLC